MTGSTGIPYGIVPPNGAYIVAGTTNCYYTAYPMSAATGASKLSCMRTRTGAYRLTARYHLDQRSPSYEHRPNTWHYYDDFSDGSSNADGSTNNYRDAAIVVSPTKARQMVMYELNVLNIDAENPANDTDYSQRSTFDDLYGGPDATTQRPFNLNYIKGLGVNWLWLQPIHPIGVQGRQTDPNETVRCFPSAVPTP